MKIGEKMNCIICNRPAVRHHLFKIGSGRNRERKLAEHCFTVPLCNLHHTEIHVIGERKFSDKYGVNVWKVTCEYLRTFIQENLDKFKDIL